MSEPTEPQPNYAARQTVAAILALGAVGGVGALAYEAADRHMRPESEKAVEALKAGDKVDIIPGSVIIPAGLNRDSRPAVGGDYQLYSDKEEIVTSPIQISTEDSPNGNKWLTYRNVDGKMVWIAETKQALSVIQVESKGKTTSLAEELAMPGDGVVHTTVRSVGPEGITASSSDVEDPQPIAIVEDRN